MRRRRSWQRRSEQRGSFVPPGKNLRVRLGSSLVTCHSSLLLGPEIHASQEVLETRDCGIS